MNGSFGGGCGMIFFVYAMHTVFAWQLYSEEPRDNNICGSLKFRTVAIIFGFGFTFVFVSIFVFCISICICICTQRYRGAVGCARLKFRTVTGTRGFFGNLFLSVFLNSHHRLDPHPRRCLHPHSSPRLRSCLLLVFIMLNPMNRKGVIFLSLQ